MYMFELVQCSKKWCLSQFDEEFSKSSKSIFIRFDVQCQRYGDWAQLPINEHIRVCSMFEKWCSSLMKWCLTHQWYKVVKFWPTITGTHHTHSSIHKMSFMKNSHLKVVINKLNQRNSMLSNCTDHTRCYPGLLQNHEAPNACRQPSLQMSARILWLHVECRVKCLK